MKKLLFLGALLLYFGLGSGFVTDTDVAYYFVTGRISTPDGLPAEGVLVYCIENPLQWDRSNEDGYYCVTVRHGQSVRVEESAYTIPEGPSATGPIRGNTKWDIVMQPNFAIVDPKGERVPDSLVQDVPSHFDQIIYH